MEMIQRSLNMRRARFIFPFPICFVVPLIAVGLCFHCVAAEEKTDQDKQKRTIVTLSPWAAKVEKAMVRYLRVSEGKFCRGYLGDNGIFYKFADEDPLDESDLPKDKEERKLRLVKNADMMVEIERPTRHTFILWKDDSFYPVHGVKDRKLMLVFLGFGKVEESEIPGYGDGPPSGGDAGMILMYVEKEGKATLGPLGPWARKPDRIPKRLLIDAEIVTVGEQKQNAGKPD
jgi:hypothetical protein